jgi:3-hydroxy-9,10-secoandrosta-1,3,5(10)-triene-9,17-dione monooxygenase
MDRGADSRAVAGDRPSRQDFLDRAEALVPLLRERAAATEAARHLLPENERAFHEAGLYRMLQPRRIGGDQLDYGILIDVGAILARGCASSAWHVTNMCSHHAILGYFAPQAQADVWDRSVDALICASLIYAAGRATPVEGGYILNGRWPFCSGIDECDWHMVGAVIEPGEGADAAAAAGNHLFLLPRADYTILDTWNVTGLAGSGSHDVEVSNVFVPAHRALSAEYTRGGPTPGSAVNPGGLFRLALQAIFPYTLAGCALGVAEGMWQDHVGATTRRAATYSGAALAGLQNIQIGIAETGAQIETAGRVMRAAVADAVAIAEAGGVPDPLTKTRYRRDGAFSVQLCRKAANSLFEATGGGGIQTKNPISRGHRDIQAIAAHIAYQMPVAGAWYGRVALGLEAEIATL